MEYPEYGIYKRSVSECGFKEKPTLLVSKSEQQRPLKPLFQDIEKASWTSGILKQIYEDISTVIIFLEDMGELLDQRVIL